MKKNVEKQISEMIINAFEGNSDIYEEIEVSDKVTVELHRLTADFCVVVKDITPEPEYDLVPCGNNQMKVVYKDPTYVPNPDKETEFNFYFSNYFQNYQELVSNNFNILKKYHNDIYNKIEEIENK